MYLLLSTIIYCVITQVLDVDYRLAMGIYLIGLGLAKGFWSQELKDVFNFSKTGNIYEKVGWKDTFLELISLLLIFLNTYQLGYEFPPPPLSLFEFIVLLFAFIMTYRFLFWGVTKTLIERGV